MFFQHREHLVVSKRGGTFTSIPLEATNSCMSKPLSAIIMSPSSKSNNPDFLVISQSDIQPSHASETKLTKPNGVQPN